MSKHAEFSIQVVKNTDAYVKSIEAIRKELATICLIGDETEQQEALIHARKRLDLARSRLDEADREVFEQYLLQ